jgi:hypothetical protein
MGAIRAQYYDSFLMLAELNAQSSYCLEI